MLRAMLLPPLQRRQAGPLFEVAAEHRGFGITQMQRQFGDVQLAALQVQRRADTRPFAVQPESVAVNDLAKEITNHHRIDQVNEEATHQRDDDEGTVCRAVFFCNRFHIDDCRSG